MRKISRSEADIQQAFLTGGERPEGYVTREEAAALLGVSLANTVTEARAQGVKVMRLAKQDWVRLDDCLRVALLRLAGEVRRAQRGADAAQDEALRLRNILVGTEPRRNGRARRTPAEDAG